VLASALFLATGAACAIPVSAAEDDFLIRAHAPCHTALVEQQKAWNRLKTERNSDADALKTLDQVRAGLDWNEKACGKLANRSVQENDVRRKMYVANEAFLLSLQGGAERILGRSSAAASFDKARPLLQECTHWTGVSRDVRANCARQISYNDETLRVGRADTGDKCRIALQAANDAGRLLAANDTASLDSAYRSIVDGLAANQSCTSDRDMRDVNQAYLLSYKVTADRALNVPFSRDRDIANPNDPFGVPNRILNTCQNWPATKPDNAAANCRRLLTMNMGQTATTRPSYVPPGATPMHFDEVAPFAPPVRLDPGFVWDQRCKNQENKTCADERIHNGVGASGWQDAPPGVATPLDDDRAERVLFATIRTPEDLGRLFAFGGQAPPLPSDFFRNKILLVAAQHKPLQQCTMSIGPDGVKSVAVTGAAPAVRVYYTLECDPPGPGPGNTVVKMISIDARNSAGAFGDVTFIENGGEIAQTR
jgi:hypothetical protein